MEIIYESYEKFRKYNDSLIDMIDACMKAQELIIMHGREERDITEETEILGLRIVKNPLYHRQRFAPVIKDFLELYFEVTGRVF